ncbi:hypothetical protein GE061_012708 [Apolygus lucorum]|uniref:HTH CENPB-type domain-containing protein n=1 Tax=Apolygus lucorum TaxID=248454 RepID=A0A8S9XTC1_APOLU|nr:hypothetical protein GE061_012708 [Apolygus lucorum]
MAEFGFPVADTDLRHIMADYLQQLSREVPKFNNNTPGKDWLEGFKKRNPEICARFAACGIVPPDVQALLKRIPGALDRPQDMAVTTEDLFLKHLESKRAEWTEKKKGGKRKKMNVPPGKSVSSEDVISAGPSSNLAPSSSSGKGRKKRAVVLETNNDDEEEEEQDFIEDESEDDADLILEQLEQEEREDEAFEELLAGKNSIKLAPVEKEIGKFCVVKYMSRMYPGKILKFDEESAEVSSMQRSLKSWKWPVLPDILDYPWKNVLGKIEPPKLISKRGFFRVHELDD